MVLALDYSLIQKYNVCKYFVDICDHGQRGQGTQPMSETSDSSSFPDTCDSASGKLLSVL